MCEISSLQLTLMRNAVSALLPDTVTVNRYQSTTQTATGVENRGAPTVIATVKCWILPVDAQTFEQLVERAEQWEGKAKYSVDFPTGTDVRLRDFLIEQTTNRKFVIVSASNDIGYSTEFQCLAVEIT